MAAKDTYTVIYERDEDGWWVASVEKVPGCLTQGKSIKQASNRIVEALGLFLDAKKLAKAKLVHKLKLTPEVQAALDEMKAAKQRAVEEESRVRETAQKIARLLTKKFHLSVRDAGELLNLSHQRVHQLVEG